MLIIIYGVLELTGTLCALLSPFIVLHWLLKIVDMAPIRETVNAIGSWIDPFNHAIELFFVPPAIQYSGHQYGTTQGALAILLLFGFMLCHTLIEILKSQEQKLHVTESVMSQKARLNKLREKQFDDKSRIIKQCQIYLYVQYEGTVCELGQRLMKDSFNHYQGETVAAQTNQQTLLFPDLESALACCNQVTENLLGYYATLRPIDAQPPFRFNLHAVEKTVEVSRAVYETQQFAKFVDSNQILFSDSIKKLLEAKDLQSNYHYQSVGIYTLPSEGKNIELFRLYTRKRSA